MKKINKLHFFLFALVAISVMFTSCKEEDLTYTSGDAFHFSDTSISVSESAASPVAIPIIFTKNSAVAGNVDISISSSTATLNTDYVVLGSTSLSFTADQYFDTLYIQPIDNAVQEEDKVIDVVITGGSAALGYPGLNGGSSFDSLQVILLDDDCPAIPTLVGTYSDVTNGGAGDGSGAIGTPLEPFGYGVPINITEESTNRYIIDDITMGLYVGGYGASGPNPATFDFEPASKNITIDTNASPDIIYGGDQFSGTGLAVDNCDGILSGIELNWSNTWGDQGSTVLTPQ